MEQDRQRNWEMGPLSHALHGLSIYYERAFGEPVVPPAVEESGEIAEPSELEPGPDVVEALTEPRELAEETLMADEELTMADDGEDSKEGTETVDEKQVEVAERIEGASREVGPVLISPTRTR
jgi:hypothetical protein